MMFKFCFSFALVLTLFVHLNRVNAEEYTLTKSKELPKETPKHLSAVLENNGLVISHKKENMLRLWMRKEIPAKANFKPSYSVNYPFATGELIGMLQILKGKKQTDFRQQELKAGLYTLRYGHIPEDGNHLGASEISDFLLALPISVDKSIKRIEKPEELSKQSAKGVEVDHPAIFSMVATEEENKKQNEKLVHDEDQEFWILHFSATVKKMTEKNNTTEKIPLQLIVIGFAEE